MLTDWAAAFNVVQREPPATAEELSRLEDDLRRPLSDAEIDSIIRSQSNPWPVSDPHHASWIPVSPVRWQMPARPLPASFLSFLVWSNGPSVVRAQMAFGFFGTSEIREYLLAYHLPLYMPMTVPLGLDGSGNFALLDVREPMVKGEYPILVAAAGDLCFDDARMAADTFEQFCLRTERVEDLLLNRGTAQQGDKADEA
jgi:hypothetical protein